MEQVLGPECVAEWEQDSSSQAAERRASCDRVEKADGRNTRGSRGLEEEVAEVEEMGEKVGVEETVDVKAEAGVGPGLLMMQEPGTEEVR